MTAGLARRAFAELLGTGLLVTVVVGSGIAAERLSADAALQLLANAVATAAGLAVVILVVGPVSGAHLNPVVSASDWLLAHHRGHAGLTGRDVAAYVPAQVGGAVGGAVLADVMFAVPAVRWSSHARGGGALWLGEVVATAGLLLVIVALARAGKPDQTPWAVGAYIGAAYFFTSSTAFANPAVSIGRAFTDTYAGIAPQSLPGFLVAQLVGGGVGLVLVAALYPDALLVPPETSGRRPT